MKFLIDNNLSPLLAEIFKTAGHDAVHLRDLDMRASPDPVVLEFARSDNRVLISADTDFGGLLARERASSPSFLLIRRLGGRRAAEQAAIILANLELVTEDLASGAVVVLDVGTRRRHRTGQRPQLQARAQRPATRPLVTVMRRRERQPSAHRPPGLSRLHGASR